MSDREIIPPDTAGRLDSPAPLSTEPRADGRADTRADRGGGPGRRAGSDPLFQVRTADLEPYVGLRYLSKLFRLIAVVLLLLLVAEVAMGLAQQGADAIPTLVPEASRLIVLAGLLWGIGDLAILLVDVGHDLRAVRILIGRQTAHVVHHAGPTNGSSQHAPRDAA